MVIDKTRLNPDRDRHYPEFVCPMTEPLVQTRAAQLGDLILMESKDKPPYLTKWASYRDHTKKDAFYLEKPTSFGGIGSTTIPLFNPCSYGFNRHLEDYTRFTKFSVGKEQIIERLREMEGMEIYIEFIERIKTSEEINKEWKEKEALFPHRSTDSS
ncbi:MAG: hypothetical protein QGF74_00075 [Candidatus Nanoarchaeia archaeon]|jgi:hypothetical protein|nr:hypothetical protein [Candidatus Nanoarchaeia archaeon]|tara:strand:- start:10409 stop:10879 length:471 start_codon:yes stop_codon:yes gene_type:complete